MLHLSHRAASQLFIAVIGWDPFPKVQGSRFEALGASSRLEFGPLGLDSGAWGLLETLLIRLIHLGLWDHYEYY